MIAFKKSSFWNREDFLDVVKCFYEKYRTNVFPDAESLKTFLLN